jgi:hypothetical protein
MRNAVSSKIWLDTIQPAVSNTITTRVVFLPAFLGNADGCIMPILIIIWI